MIQFNERLTKKCRCVDVRFHLTMRACKTQNCVEPIENGVNCLKYIRKKNKIWNRADVFKPLQHKKMTLDNF